MFFTNTSTPTPTTISTILNSKTYMIIGAITLLLIAGALIYYFYGNNRSAFTEYKANREHMEDDESSNKTAELMLFYADWCPHCKTAKPEWESVKSQYDNRNINGYKVLFKEFNCSSQTPEIEEQMDKYSIEGFPTIKMLKDSQLIEFDAKPTKENLEKFLNSAI
jgi:thiol-disulfide isomerase/thioredoxin